MEGLGGVVGGGDPHLALMAIETCPFTVTVLDQGAVVPVRRLLGTLIKLHKTSRQAGGEALAPAAVGPAAESGRPAPGNSVLSLRRFLPSLWLTTHLFSPFLSPSCSAKPASQSAAQPVDKPPSSVGG